jgi:hypothetical protein
LRQALVAEGEADLKPILDGTTRFGCKEAMATRAIKLLPAATNINPVEMVGIDYTEEDWKSDLSDMQINKELVEEIRPLFVLTSQWVQVMSSQSTVTMSLVRVMMTRYDSAIKDLLARARQLSGGPFPKKQLGIKLDIIHNAFRDAYEEYFSDECYDFYAFVIAEFLDPRTFLLITQEYIQLFKDSVEGLLLPSEGKIHRPVPVCSATRRSCTRSWNWNGCCQGAFTSKPNSV